MGEKKKVLYILGPFDSKSGLDDYAAVDDMLTDLGYATISPALIPEGMDKTKAHFVAVAMIDVADAVVVLPNWRASKDAVAERHLACGLGKPMVETEHENRSVNRNGINPPEVIKAWLKHDLEQVLEEVSA